jgi:hypothetical protein
MNKAILLVGVAIVLVIAGYWFFIKPNIKARDACNGMIEYHIPLFGATEYYEVMNRQFKTKEDAMDYCVPEYKKILDQYGGG